MLAESTQGQSMAQGSSLPARDQSKVGTPRGSSGGEGALGQFSQDAMKQTETRDMQERQGGSICHRDKTHIPREKAIGGGVIASSLGKGRPVKLRSRRVCRQDRCCDVEVKGLRLPNVGMVTRSAL